MPLPVILIFDIGKTNKKLLLFDKQYQLVYESYQQLEEIKDEDGFPCEDLDALTVWVTKSFQKIKNDKRFVILAVNVSAYGASLVHLNDRNQAFLPLYSYLKPYDEDLHRQFYNQYGGEEKIAKQTASPVLDNLNSGMQLYGLKYKRPGPYANISCSLHLPQYINFVLGGALVSDITSIGCHTALWNFEANDYHTWVYKEGINKKLAPVASCTQVAATIDNDISIGSGLHDSSAALIPYCAGFKEPFILLSTGTWTISINPFNQSLLTTEELKQDCLSFLSFQGNSVKASRLFAGYELEQQVKRIAAHYHTTTGYFKTILFDASICNKLNDEQPATTGKGNSSIIESSPFSKRDLHHFKTGEEAYHQLMLDIIKQQVPSTKLVMNDTLVHNLFVDGGFSKNDVYMHLLAAAFPQLKVYAAEVAQASALGAAIAIRKAWNDSPLPSDLITVKRYEPAYHLVL